MVTPPIAAAFEATVLFSTAASLVFAAYSLRSAFAAPGRGAAARSVLGRLGHPLVQLGLVCLLLWANQILFSAYVLRAHHGDTTFIARFIGSGWFAIDAHDPIVRFVAAHVGDAAWLSPSVLRVQAFLELPFTLFAYLAVARLLGSALQRRLTSLPMLYLASITWSITFSLVEVALTNPYTRDDLVLRAFAAIVVPVYVARVSRASLPSREREDGPSGLFGLLAFLAGAGAISYIVLAVYDAFLLYNLAHLSRYATGLAAASLVAGAASAVGPRVDAWLAKARGGARDPSPAMDVCASTLQMFTLFFFAPSLAIRYRGHLPYAVLAGMLLVGLSLALGAGGAVKRVLARARGAVGSIATLVIAGASAALAGGWAAWAVFVAAPHAVIPELVLARVALSFLVASIVTFRAVEIAVCWARHEAKAQADEA